MLFFERRGGASRSFKDTWMILYDGCSVVSDSPRFTCLSMRSLTLAEQSGSQPVIIHSFFVASIHGNKTCFPNKNDQMNMFFLENCCMKDDDNM